MGSPLRPLIANILMCSFEEKWIWLRYVDDTFTIFQDRESTLKIENYLSQEHCFYP